MIDEERSTDLLSSDDLEDIESADEEQNEFEEMNLPSRPPTSAENNRLLQEYHDHPSLELRNEIVEKNLLLVVSIASDYSKLNHVSIDDLIQEGSLGLINAVEDYDISLGYAFSTFATPYIKNAIRTFLTKNSRIISIPNWLQTRKRKVQNAREKLKLTLERDPTDQEVADYLDDGTTVEDISDLNIFFKDVYSLDQNIRKEGEDPGSLYDVVPDDGYSPSDVALLQEQSELLSEAIQTLPEREREIFLARNSDGSSSKLKDLAERFGLSNERIRQIEFKAKKQVLNYIKERM